MPLGVGAMGNTFISWGGYDTQRSQSEGDADRLNPATFSNESRALCGLTAFGLRYLTSSLLMTGSFSCSSHDHITPDRTRGSRSVHSLSHAPSREFSSVCPSQHTQINLFFFFLVNI